MTYVQVGTVSVRECTVTFVVCFIPRLFLGVTLEK